MRLIYIIAIIMGMIFPVSGVMADKEGEKPGWWEGWRIKREHRQKLKEISEQKREVAAEKMRRRLWRERFWFKSMEGMTGALKKSSSVKWAVLGFGAGAIYVFCATHKCLPGKKDEDDE